MKINLTKNEYRSLLDVLYLGAWMLTSHDIEELEEKKKYNDLIQKFYSYAKEMGYEELVESDQSTNKYYITRQYEDMSGMDEIIDEYDSESFWEELIPRLAERDAIDIKGVDSLNKMTFEEKIEFMHPLEKKYYDEFINNGLKHLKINET